MRKAGRPQLVPVPPITETTATRRKKVPPQVDKGPSRGRTVRLKSKILIAAAQPLSGRGIRRPQPVETLFAVSRAVGSRMDVTEVLRQTTRELVRALAADFGSVWGVNPVDRELKPIAGFRLPDKLRLLQGSDRAPRLPKATMDVSTVIYSSESDKDPRFDHPLLRLLPHRSVLIQPMHIRGEIAGILAFAWTRSRHRFNDIELRLVDAVTQQAANAIENADLLAKYAS